MNKSTEMQYHLDAICQILYEEEKIYKPRVIIEYMSRDYGNRRFIKVKPDYVHNSKAGPQLKAVVDKVLIAQQCDKPSSNELVFDLDLF